MRDIFTGATKDIIRLTVISLFVLQTVTGCGTKSTTKISSSAKTPISTPELVKVSTETPISTKIPLATETPFLPTEVPTVSNPADQIPNDTDNIFVIKLLTPFDSPRIAFTSDDGDLRVIKPDSVDSSDIVRLTFEGGRSDRQPTWAPDRQRIAFISSGEPKPAVDGATITQITFDGAANPAWSPDGAYIAFDYENEIYIVTPDGTGLVGLANIEGEDPTWAPDSKHLAFTLRGMLYVTNIDDPQPERLALDDSQLSCPPSDVHKPVWSPDGNAIAFDSHPECVRGTAISIYTVDMNTLIITHLGGGTYETPHWSPDSNYIVFNSYIREISIMTRNGEVNVSGDYIQDYPGNNPVWSP